jgi:hypothetical protein
VRLSADWLELLFLLLVGPVTAVGLALLELSPAINALVACGLPVLLVLALALALLDLFILAALFTALLLHLGLGLPAPALLVVDEHHLGLVGPLAVKVVSLELGTVDRPLVLPDQQHASIRNGLVKPLAVLLVHQLRLRLLESVKGLGRERVPGFVRVDQQRFLPVYVLDVGFGHARLQAKDGVAAPDAQVSKFDQDGERGEMEGLTHRAGRP